MTTPDLLDPLAGVAAVVCALVVFLGVALEGPDDAPPVVAQIVGSSW